MLVPTNTSEYLVLYNFVSAVITDTELLSFSSIKHGKRIKQKTHYSNDTMQNTLRKAVNDCNESVLGKFAATLVWILYTKQMSVVQNASMLRTGMSYCNGFNNESRILRTLPPKKVTPVVVNVPQVEVAEEPVVPKPPEKLQNEDDIIPESWEDLDI